MTSLCFLGSDDWRRNVKLLLASCVERCLLKSNDHESDIETQSIYLLSRYFVPIFNALSSKPSDIQHSVSRPLSFKFEF